MARAPEGRQRMASSPVTSHEMLVSSRSTSRRGGFPSDAEAGVPPLAVDGSSEGADTSHDLVTIHGEEPAVFHHQTAVDDAVADIGAAGGVDQMALGFIKGGQVRLDQSPPR